MDMETQHIASYVQMFKVCKSTKRFMDIFTDHYWKIFNVMIEFFLFKHLMNMNVLIKVSYHLEFFHFTFIYKTVFLNP